MTNSFCKLCGENKKLQNSHVVPAFAYRWLRETSGNGFLRSAIMPNKRVQDGLKFYWLCSDCEQKFSHWETAFSNKIFYPLNQQPHASVQYKKWLLLFCTSVSWRVLNFHLQEGYLKNFSPTQLEWSHNALRVWKEFLVGMRPHPDIYEQHFLPLDALESHSFDHNSMPPNINRYMLRTIDIDVAVGENTAFTYTKIGRFIILGFLSSPIRKEWVGTKIHVNSGRIHPKTYILPKTFANYFLGKARRAGSILDNISATQQSKIDHAFKQNIDKLANSETFTALQHDVRMFGRAAFREKEHNPPE